MIVLGSHGGLECYAVNAGRLKPSGSIVKARTFFCRNALDFAKDGQFTVPDLRANGHGVFEV